MLEGHWVLLRATGLVLVVALGALVAAGIASKRAPGPRSQPGGLRVPSYFLQGLHRQLSLLVVVFTVAHAVLAVTDRYVPIGWSDLVVPGGSSWHPGGLIPGVLAFDLLLVIVVSSAFKHRLADRTWRRLHLLAYPCVGLGVAHGVIAGTDTGTGLAWACLGLGLGLALVATWWDRLRRPMVTP